MVFDTRPRPPGPAEELVGAGYVFVRKVPANRINSPERNFSRSPSSATSNASCDHRSAFAAAGFTSRLLEPSEQWSLLDLGYGLTNAAPRTTRGSSDLRRADFAGSAERLEQIVGELRPEGIAFVGKAAYEGAFRERPELGLQDRRLVDAWLFVPAVDLAREPGRAPRGAPAVVHGPP